VFCVLCALPTCLCFCVCISFKRLIGQVALWLPNNSGNCNCSANYDPWMNNQGETLAPKKGKTIPKLKPPWKRKREWKPPRKPKSLTHEFMISLAVLLLPLWLLRRRVCCLAFPNLPTFPAWRQLSSNPHLTIVNHMTLFLGLRRSGIWASVWQFVSLPR